MLLIVAIIPFITTAIEPGVCSKSVHHSTLEGSLELATVGPLERSLTAHLIVSPLANISTTICPEVAPLSGFHSADEVAMIIASIAPDFDSSAVLELFG